MRIRWTALVVFASPLAFAPAIQAGGYYYEARSYYVAPPLTYYSVIAPAPIVVYEPAVMVPAPVYYRAPVVVAPAPVVSYSVAPAPVVSYAAPVPAYRYHENWNYSPNRDRYRYEVKYPGGLEYEYRYKRDGNWVRFREKWDD